MRRFLGSAQLAAMLASCAGGVEALSAIFTPVIGQRPHVGERRSPGIIMGPSTTPARPNWSKRARRERIANYIAAHRNEPDSGWKRAVRRGKL